jgi:hypothetical protein
VQKVRTYDHLMTPRILYAYILPVVTKCTSEKRRSESETAISLNETKTWDLAHINYAL